MSLKHCVHGMGLLLCKGEPGILEESGLNNVVEGEKELKFVKHLIHAKCQARFFPISKENDGCPHNNPVR